MFFSLFFLVTAVQHFLSVLKYIITKSLPASLMAQLWQGMSPFWRWLDLALFTNMPGSPAGVLVWADTLGQRLNLLFRG